MTNSEIKPLDSVPESWVDGMPAALRPYLRLMRLDRPIGSWLLFWPCVFGLALGAAIDHRPFLATGRDWWMLVLFGLGTLVMRGAGCTYNDIVDRDFDAQVARTRARPIPSGAVSVKQAATELGIPADAVYNWLRLGQVPARRGPSGRWCIPWDPATQEVYRQKVAASFRLKPLLPAAPPSDPTT